ncbi:MAG TPA: GNAT family N-acetyltransferase [Niabella sp.]|nr:GNAT family N-acetyltransferase [Niabella sp.]HQW15071.1 GNAT family N-acetyltransferase [Niabella sp.]HQX20212.1 GNAT family N-acetyltransferase [Niabella sp.]HQX41291.1 GNAT family N-acetyltransferase [Niabella sp.]HRB08372.1 GNAT family N-acetyltransferase [Niabella sp.]
MIEWTSKTFHQLTTDELYEILQLRSAVFVVEQHCYYLDLDDKDKTAYHLLGKQDNSLIAYSRILPPGLSYPQPSIGRVVLKQTARAKGLGKTLMLKSIQMVYESYGVQAIKISAQLYLQNFYATLGFSTCSAIYDDAGIDHVEMMKP